MLILIIFPALDAHIIDLPSVMFSHYAHILTIRFKQNTYHFTITYNDFPLLLSLPDSNSATLYAVRLKQYPLRFLYQTYHGYCQHLSLFLHTFHILPPPIILPWTHLFTHYPLYLSKIFICLSESLIKHLSMALSFRLPYANTLFLSISATSNFHFSPK